MNGSENGYAGALFFALISLGALLKLDDSVGWIVGAICALLSAISLRRALIKAAQANEEDHQRIEIQFQQLRNKIAEITSSTATAIESVNDAAQLVQENMRLFSARLDEFDNLDRLIASVESVGTTLAALDENSSALNAEIEKFFVAFQEQDNSAAVTVELEKIVASVGKLNSNLAEIVKRDKSVDLAKIVSSVGKLDANLTALVKISDKSVELKKIAASMSKLDASLTELVKRDKSSADKPSALDENDLSLLKEIVAKISLK